MTREEIEDMIFGVFVSLYRGLTLDGRSSVKETLYGFLDHTDIPTEDARFYTDILATLLPLPGEQEPSSDSFSWLVSLNEPASVH